MDDIAEAAGVGRRTLFRHFESRERLLAQALESGMQHYGDHLPPFEGDWHEWLHATCRAAREMQAGYGPGYWELVSRVDLAPEIAAVEADRRRRRRKVMERIADKAWTAAGGSGPAPTSVRAAATSHLSARFTAAVIEDAGQSWTVAADQAESAITGAIATALSAP
jgi:AcrR family transcriptional regulator